MISNNKGREEKRKEFAFCANFILLFLFPIYFWVNLVYGKGTEIVAG